MKLCNYGNVSRNNLSGLVIHGFMSGRGLAVGQCSHSSTLAAYKYQFTPLWAIRPTRLAIDPGGNHHRRGAWGKVSM
jgi:hypothetical protein